MEKGRKDYDDEVGKVMATGWTGEEREKLIVNRQTSEKSQHKIEVQSIRLWLAHKRNCTCTQFNIQTQNWEQIY